MQLALQNAVAHALSRLDHLNLVYFTEQIVITYVVQFLLCISPHTHLAVAVIRPSALVCYNALQSPHRIAICMEPRVGFSGKCCRARTFYTLHFSKLADFHLETTHLSAVLLLSLSRLGCHISSFRYCFLHCNSDTFLTLCMLVPVTVSCRQISNYRDISCATRY